MSATFDFQSPAVTTSACISCRWLACGLGLAGSILVAVDGMASGAAESVHGPLADEAHAENVRRGDDVWGRESRTSWSDVVHLVLQLCMRCHFVLTSVHWPPFCIAASWVPLCRHFGGFLRHVHRSHEPLQVCISRYRCALAVTGVCRLRP